MLITYHITASLPSIPPSLPPSLPVPPYFTTRPTNSTAIEGSAHTLICAAAGDPTPLITWSLSGDVGTVLSTQGTLLFTSISRSDSCRYTCTASNSAGLITVEIYLDVQCKSVASSPGFPVWVRVEPGDEASKSVGCSCNHTWMRVGFSVHMSWYL